MTETDIPTTDEILASTDLSEKTFLVTGATSGLGAETARALAAHGADVLITGRTLARAKEAAERIVAHHPDARVTPFELELGSLDSVDACVRAVLGARDALHGLIANAGVMAVPRGTTADGFETQFGTNHIGHFALVTGLVPQLVAAAPSRVVMLSSAGHRWADIDLDDVGFERRPYRKFQAYGASKTANVLFAVELDRRLREHGVRAYAVHPGGIQTNLGRHLTERDQAKLSGGAAAEANAFRSVGQGAATSVWAATSADLDGTGGTYLEDCAVAAVTGPEVATGVRDFAVDPARAARLWELSDELLRGAGKPRTRVPALDG